MTERKRRDLGPMPHSVPLQRSCTQAQLVLLEKLQEGQIDRADARSIATFLKATATKADKNPEKKQLLHSTEMLFESILLALDAGWISPEPGPQPNASYLREPIKELCKELDIECDTECNALQASRLSKTQRLCRAIARALESSAYEQEYKIRNNFKVRTHPHNPGNALQTEEEDWGYL